MMAPCTQDLFLCVLFKWNQAHSALIGAYIVALWRCNLLFPFASGIQLRGVELPPSSLGVDRLQATGEVLVPSPLAPCCHCLPACSVAGPSRQCHASSEDKVSCCFSTVHFPSFFPKRFFFGSSDFSGTFAS